MKRLAMGVMLAALVLAVQAAQSETLRGMVVGVTDGDTVSVLTEDFQNLNIRVAGIDAPEKAQPFGSRSKWNLSACSYGRLAEIEASKRDRYGRTVGKVVVSGVDCGLRQIEAGLAWHYKAYAKEQSAQDRVRYAQAEEEARERRLGLWVQEEPQAPWEFRRQR